MDIEEPVSQGPTDSQLIETEEDEQDTFKILVATDNHLGYLEKDPVRGDDSFAAFEEILSLAVKSEVDMILLGGDLFHENKPSRKSMHVASKLLKKYCMGDKPVSLEYLSEPSDNFPEGIDTVNYMDANLNVSIPVFSIHGNHDDPSGEGNLCALDLLAMNGLVNYFGRSQEIDNVVVKPILLRKGVSRLALFGIGNIRDERLHQTFLRRNVKLLRPLDEDGEEPWYNLLVLHQNRVMHGPKNYIPESFLDDFIDLVIWGHEHECLIDPQYNPQQGFHVSQPGSSVATSLSEGESKDKHVAILKICKNKLKVEKVRLRSVRPFIMRDVVLADQQLDPTKPNKVSSFISKRIRELVQDAKEEWIAKNGTSRKRRMYSDGGSDDEEPVQGEDIEGEIEAPKPLVRLRVEYSGGFEIFNPQRFGHEFVDLVANPRDIVQFFRKKTGYSAKNAPKSKVQEMDAVDAPEKLDAARVENLVQKYLSAQHLSILAENQLEDAVRVFVEKDEKDAVKDFVAASLKRMQKAMRTKQNIEIEEALLKEINKEKGLQAVEYARETPNGASLNTKRSSANDGVSMDVDDQDEGQDSEDNEDIAPSKSRAKGASSTATSKRTALSSTKSSRVASIPNAAGSNTRSRANRGKVLAADSQDEEENEGGGDVVAVSDDEDDDGEYKEPQNKSVARSSKTAFVIEDTDSDELEDDFLASKRGTKAKGKARAASPTKPKATTPRKLTAATPKKPTTATLDAGETTSSTSTLASTTTAGTGRGRTPASASRAGASQASQASQGARASQGHSRLVSAIGNRRKKLMG
ncbi:Double-strand break repair protein mre11a [Podila epigama]|nr:Double-strand break repair protein mre11a [Podila epigama]